MAVSSAPAPPVVVDLYALPPARPWYTDVWIRMLRRKPLGTIGGAIVLTMLLAAVLADVLTPYGFSQTSLRERFIASNAEHWLGTDQLGRDMLTRILYGARISLYVGFGAVALGSLLATVLGISSAYGSGRVDLFLQRVVDAWMAFPPLLILMSIMSLLGPSVLNITLVLGIAAGIRESRIVRGVALSIKENTYIEGTRALGSGHLRVTRGSRSGPPSRSRHDAHAEGVLHQGAGRLDAACQPSEHNATPAWTCGVGVGRPARDQCDGGRRRNRQARGQKHSMSRL